MGISVLQPSQTFPVGDRRARKFPGNCRRGKCEGEELACKEDDDGKHYSCLCVHDKKPPMPDGTCPRITVPIEPASIPHVQPPSNTPHRNGVSINSTTTNLPESTPSHPIAQPAIASIQLNYYVVAGSICMFFTIFLVLSLILKRKYCSKHRHNLIASPVNLKNNLLMSKRYAPNPQYTACAGTGVPLLKKETLKFLYEIGEGCFGKVYKGIVDLSLPDTSLQEAVTRKFSRGFSMAIFLSHKSRHKNMIHLVAIQLFKHVFKHAIYDDHNVKLENFIIVKKIRK
ncbi:hypothetical protein WA026_006781 [Henosepilachna vigintioctopunctata]|uniref:Protein kinase domain-containing protein n=1 Tax=Henosepilachna vigintioctopunctata TaxID=420089 RepID=A0AAW1UJ30_9CUCU